jgi:hypothetical protein
MAKLKTPAKRRTGWNRAGVTWLAIITAGLWLSGVGMHLWAADAAFDLPQWQDHARRISTVAHGALAWFFCLLAGRWIWPHISTVWRRRSPPTMRPLGQLTLFTVAVAALAGLGLLYGSPPWRDHLAAVHWWIALFWPLLAGAHVAGYWMRDPER